ncbi:E3 ubiquitin-protein ligase Iruka-like [Anopheles nili]|uniref:E3 ubiquitin-protein ligase Iruka-like n=1 Tax=Anopheles nili TaxID=185578 RepID=UPI00237C0A49|nr:E3 ubiquitin-protein ligase Iruka-like [Anopheles nili]
MEALVENTAATPSRFYCHSCAMEIDRVSSEFTCPHCQEGFIEELPVAERGGASGPASGQDFELLSNDYDNPQISNEAIRLAGEIFTNSFLSPLFRRNDGPDGESAGTTSNGDQASLGHEDIPMNGVGQGSGTSTASGSSTIADMAEGSASSSTAASGAAGGDSRPSMRYSGRRGSRRRGVQNINQVDHILREILISVSGGANGGAGAPLLFMGNPGDYAWGREGIDTIVTQLLNQMDSTGPPPLEKERIAEIPTVTINEEQVERKLQCSVCFEDFVVGESVRKLSCLHVYHDPCIIPWLELHGTCPICRKSLSPEESHAGSQSQSQNTQSQNESSQQNSQQQPSSQTDAGRQNPNFLTFTIHDLLPTLSGPTMTNLLFDMGQTLASAAPAASVSSSLPATASGSATGGAADNASSGGSTLSRTNAPPGGSSTSGNSSQSSNSQRDDDGTIDYTLDLD